MKLSTEVILERLEELTPWQKTSHFISSLDLTPKQMELLVNRKNKWIRRGLAENLSITEKIMIQLSRDEDEFVKYILAKNPKITEKIMLQLASDIKLAREGLAENPNLTEEITIQLVNDEYEYIKWELSQNHNITEKIIIQLASDEDEGIRGNAFVKLKDLNSLKKEELEKAYDLIRKSKYISRKNFEETFDYIIDKFSEVSELAKMFKTIILKGKKDLK